MTTLRHLRFLLSVFGASAALVACGVDNQGLRSGDNCPPQPLYHYDRSGDTWVKVSPDGTPLTADQLATIARATSPGCLTGPGDGGT